MELQKIFSFFSVTFIVFLGLLFLLLIKNLNYRILEKSNHVKLILFWNKKDIKKVEKDWEKIKRLNSVLYVRGYIPEEALELLIKRFSELRTIKSLIKENPIPPTAVVVFKGTKYLNPDQFEKDLKLIDSLKGVHTINLTNINLNWIKKWKQLEKFLLFFLGLSGFLTAFIMSNTFSISLLHRKKEIEVLWLVGATRFYIVFPEVVRTIFYLITSSAISLGLTYYFYFFLNNLLNSPPLWFEVKFFTPIEICTYVIFLLGVSLAVVLGTTLFYFKTKIKGDIYEE